MSEMEYHTGRIKILYPLDGQLPQDLARGLCKYNGYEDKHNQGWIETLRDEGYDDGYIVLDIEGNYEIWKLIEHKSFDDGTMFQVEKEADGSISFCMSFYNGGTCLSEMLEEVVKESK